MSLHAHTQLRVGSERREQVGSVPGPLPALWTAVRLRRRSDRLRGWQGGAESGHTEEVFPLYPIPWHWIIKPGRLAGRVGNPQKA